MERLMIIYSVQCSHGHVFDEWFSNSADYDSKAAVGEIVCPDCGDLQVRKAIMAPRVAKAAADVALTGSSDVLDVSPLGLDRFDERGHSRLATDPIALPFPERIST